MQTFILQAKLGNFVEVLGICAQAKRDLTFGNMFVTFHLFTLMEGFWIYQE